MRRRRYILLFLLLLLIPFQRLRAQFDVHFAQYWNVTGYYNPAWAGATDKLNVTGIYAMQLSGFNRAPRTMYFGADLPFRLFDKNHGAGIGFFNDVAGLFRNQRLWLQYAYQAKIKKGRLGIGVQAGMINVAFDPTDLDLGEGGESDPAFPTQQQSGTGVDLAIGAYYTHPLFYVGFSGQHLTAPTLEFGSSQEGLTTEIKIKPMLYFTGGYNIKTRNPLIFIQPSLFVQSDLTATRVDLTGRAFYSFNGRTFNAGLTYSPNTSVTFSLGAKIQRVTVGYAYEMYTSQIGAAHGSHELVVSYAMDINLFKKSKNLHKSIRIL